MSEHLTLGPAPRPTTGADLLARMRTASLDEAPPSLRPAIEQLFAGMRAEVDGADVTIDADATDVRVDGLFADGAGASNLLPTRDAETRVVEQGALRSLTVRAHPMHVEGVPVDLGVTLEGARIAWVGAVADGTVGLDLVDPDDAHPLRGHLRIEAPLAETTAAVQRVAETQLAGLGVTLAALDVRLRSEGPRSVHVEGDARIKKGFLGTPASVSATLRVDDALRIHVEDLRMTSSNVIVSGLLATVRGRVEAATKEPYDLAAQLPAGVRVTDVQVQADERIGLEARLG